MHLEIFQVDAFAEKPFSGNPAAVVPLKSWLPKSTMQAIAEENNLSETAFIVKEDKYFHIRWFTPTTEVKLCGHATLASAFVLKEYLGHQVNPLIFKSKSGLLSVTHEGENLSLDFPQQEPKPIASVKGLYKALGEKPHSYLAAEDLIAVFDHEEQIKQLTPDFALLKQLPYRGVIATAPGKRCDFVCRFFAPQSGIDEDPVTGSAYTELGPYWGKVLNKTKLSARQLSKRGGKVHCELQEKRILIRGKVMPYLQGSITI